MYATQVHRRLDEKRLNEFLKIHRRVFENPYTESQILARVEGKQHFLAVHAYFESQIVGFKTGYALDNEVFYGFLWILYF